MKSYLSKFANQEPRIKDKSIEPVPPEPPKGTFGGFGGAPPVLLPIIQSACELNSNLQENPERRNAMPYINQYGDLVIPFDSPEKYHWWRGGQGIEATLKELLLWEGR